MGFRLEDLHVHSHLSSCCMDERMTPNAILAFAEAHDYASLCLTDHLWVRAVPGASGWYAPQDIDHVRSSLPLPKSEKLPFYFGCETELPANGIPALAREHFELFDFVVIPPNHMHMKGFVRPEGVDTPKKMADCVTDRLENLLNLDLPCCGDRIAFVPTKELRKDRKKLTDLYRACGYFGKKSLLVQEKKVNAFSSEQRCFPYAAGIHVLKKGKLGWRTVRSSAGEIPEPTNINILRAALTSFLCCDAGK